jgi:hypothetical protein
MSERRHEAVPVAFRVIERDAAQTADALAWLAPAPEEVRPVEFAHRSATPRAWTPRQVGAREARRDDASAADAPLANLPVANLPVANLPVANLPVANLPVANAPVANGAVANLPVGGKPAANAPLAGAHASTPDASAPVGAELRRAAEAEEREPRSDTHALRPSLPPSNEAPPLASGPSANERPSLAAPVIPPALLEAAEALATARTELLAHAEGELVELAVEIARSILGAELEARPELHRSLVRAGLDVLGGESTPRVRISPESFDAIVTATGSRTLEAHGQRVELEPDPSVRGAGALLDAGSASVDGRLDTRLERVRAALLVARRGGVIGEAA